MCVFFLVARGEVCVSTVTIPLRPRESPAGRDLSVYFVGTVNDSIVSTSNFDSVLFLNNHFSVLFLNNRFTSFKS